VYLSVSLGIEGQRPDEPGATERGVCDSDLPAPLFIKPSPLFITHPWLQAVRKGGRLVKDSVITAATLNCIERLRGQREPCKLHLQLSFYRVGAAEVKAAQQDQQLSPQVLYFARS